MPNPWSDEEIRSILKEKVTDEAVALWDWAYIQTAKLNQKYWAYNILKRLAIDQHTIAADRKRMKEMQGEIEACEDVIKLANQQGERIKELEEIVKDHMDDRFFLFCVKHDFKLDDICKRQIQMAASIECLEGALEPVWIVNDLGELGVKVGGRFFFLYKGNNIEYGEDDDAYPNGIVLYDDGSPMLYRIVGKREFGETCQPECYYSKGYNKKGRYTEPLVYTEGLSSGKPDDGEWKPLPTTREARSVKPDRKEGKNEPEG